MLTFETGIDVRCRDAAAPTVARFRVSSTAGYRYCIIGTQYGYLHTSAGDVRTWKTPSGAYRAIKRYTPL